MIWNFIEFNLKWCLLYISIICISLKFAIHPKFDKIRLNSHKIEQLWVKVVLVVPNWLCKRHHIRFISSAYFLSSIQSPSTSELMKLHSVKSLIDAKNTYLDSINVIHENGKASEECQCDESSWGYIEVN